MLDQVSQSSLWWRTRVHVLRGARWLAVLNDEIRGVQHLWKTSRFSHKSHVYREQGKVQMVCICGTGNYCNFFLFPGGVLSLATWKIPFISREHMGPLTPFLPFLLMTFSSYWGTEGNDLYNNSRSQPEERKLIVTYCPEYFFFLCWCHSLSWQDLGNIYLFNLKSHLLVSAAYNLGVLLNLEELIIPAGKGITSAAKLIVQQCLHLLHLRCFSFALHMDDDSLLEIGEFKGENLKHEITFLNREDTASE